VLIEGTNHMLNEVSNEMLAKIKKKRFVTQSDD
jgi:hypothetical protein